MCDDAALAVSVRNAIHTHISCWRAMFAIMTRLCLYGVSLKPCAGQAHIHTHMRHCQAAMVGHWPPAAACCCCDDSVPK